MTAVERFASLGGAPVERITISAHGLTAKVLSWGAVLQDLRLDPHPQPLVLGFPDFSSYLAQTQNFGAIVGRVATPSAYAPAPSGGRGGALAPTARAPPPRPGARDGAGRRLWRVAEAGGDVVTLALHLPDGHMGFPGALDARESEPGPIMIQGDHEKVWYRKVVVTPIASKQSSR